MVPRLVPEILSQCAFCDGAAGAAAAAGIGDSRSLITMQKELTFIFSVDNFNIYPNTRLGKLVKAKKLEVNHNLVDTKRNSSTYISNTSFHVFQDILDLCDDFCPGEPPEYFFDR